MASPFAIATMRPSPAARELLVTVVKVWEEQKWTVNA
jgi:hypothetical protein